jgi:hypothetical protein
VAVVASPPFVGCPVLARPGRAGRHPARPLTGEHLRRLRRAGSAAFDPELKSSPRETCTRVLRVT